MGKKRVLEVAFPALNNSGVPAVIMGIVRELHNEVDFDVLVFRREAGYHEKEFLSYGGSIHHIDSDRSNSRIRNLCEKLVRPWRLYVGVKKILGQEHYDAIHCHNGFDACWCLMAARRMGVPVRAVHSHASANPYEHRGMFIRSYESLCKKLISANANKLIACSMKAAQRIYGQRQDQALIIYNAVDMAKFNHQKYNCKAIDSESPVIAYVGRFSVEKNADFAVEVFSKIHEEKSKATLIMVGFGKQEEKLKEKVKQLKIEDDVLFLPSDSNIPAVLSKCDAFLVPSQAEGFGIALLEAQAMGTLSFASDTVPEEANVGLCTYLPLDIGAEEWKNKILESLAANEGKRVYPSAGNLEKYTWSSISKQYLDVYLEKH